MVDAQFRDDKYVDNEERNREAVAEVNRLAAERERLTAPRKTRAQKMSERALAIQAAAKKAEHSGKVVLDEFSKFTPNGETISVTVKRMAPQELLAGDLLPTGARRLVNYFVEVGMAATAGERNRVGMESIPSMGGESIVEEVFDGDTISAAEAYTQMINSICINCVRDPDIRLYWNERAKGDDLFGLTVDSIPFVDREKIANWALRQEEIAVESVTPFPTTEDDAHAVSAVERWNGSAQRPDGV